jgi:subtilisin
MIDACYSVRRFATGSTCRDVRAPLLRWVDEWAKSAGRGICLGLLDSGLDERLPDLRGAEFVVKDFTSGKETSQNGTEHGSHSTAILIGQGHYQICGIVPRVRLLVAKVVESSGIASPNTVAEAIDWAVSSSAHIVALPLGDPTEDLEIVQEIERGYRNSGVMFFAAAGNSHPEPLMFPANHPLAVAIGAADFKGRLLSECSRLPRLDLVAPGWKIPAPVHCRAIRRRSGSSVACIIAAGVAALAISAESSLPKRLNRTSILTKLSRDRGARSSSPTPLA